MTTIAQVRSELKTLYDESWAIIAKNGGSITDEMPNEDRTRLAENKAKMLEREPVLDRLIADEGDTQYFAKGRDEYTRPAEQHRQPTTDPRGAFAVSVGSGVVASEEYQAAKRGGLLSQTGFTLRVPVPADVSLAQEAKRAGLERKALVTSVDGNAGAFVVTDRLAGVTNLVRGQLAWLDVLPTQQTTSDLVEWIQQDTRTNNAAPVAEATAGSGTSGLKPESALAYSIQQRGVETIATTLPVTVRILNDAPMLRSTIDDELMYMLSETLEAQTVNGNGTSPNLLGINNVAGIQTIAAGANPADALFTASLAVLFTGGVPANVAVVGVNTFSALRLMRENSATGTLGNYLFGPPNTPGPMTVFGLTVVTAQAMPANTAFVLNATATTLALVERQSPTIESGWANDDFLRNIVRLRAEERAAMVYRRPKGICKVTGLP